MARNLRQSYALPNEQKVAGAGWVKLERFSSGTVGQQCTHINKIQFSRCRYGKAQKSYFHAESERCIPDQSPARACEILRTNADRHIGGPARTNGAARKGNLARIG